MMELYNIHSFVSFVALICIITHYFHYCMVFRYMNMLQFIYILQHIHIMNVGHLLLMDTFCYFSFLSALNILVHFECMQAFYCLGIDLGMKSLGHRACIYCTSVRTSSLHSQLQCTWFL